MTIEQIAMVTTVRALRVGRSRQKPSSPADLAKMLDPKFRIVPVTRLLSDVAVRAVEEPDQRDVVTMPPRSGKSRLLSIWTPVWALMRNPDMSIMVVSYSDELAQAHSREIRRIVNEHSDYLAYSIASDKSSVGRWAVEGRRGGLLAGGIQSGATGFGADLLIIDDPVKDAAEADSAAHRKRVLGEYRSSLSTRLHPGGSTLLGMTRWHERDLAGELLDAEPDVWTHTNVPAVAETGITDVLRREPGVAMISALGFTADHFAAARRTSGERAWYALYEGVPSAPEGGVVKREWLDQWRLPVAPPGAVKTVIGVDPSDSGSGDACGLIAASLTADGVIALIADVSEPLSSEQWARWAVDLAITTGASEISIESFAAGTTYQAVVTDTIKRMRPDRPIRVSTWPPKASGRGKGDAEARSAALRQALEVGTCRVAGHLPSFEAQAVAWQSGQHQPDSLAAAVVAHDVLVHSIGAQWGLASPLDTERRAREGTITSLPAWMTRRISG